VCHLIKSAEINLPVIRTEDVNDAIRTLKPKSSCGLDTIPNFIIKGLINILAPILASLFNWSLSLAYFPDHWKTFVISPIPKNDGKTINDFRPISIINVIPKVFEKVIYNLIYRKVHGKISLNQHAFVSGRSTTTNLVNFLSYIGPVVQNRGQVDVIYLDFSKAFDKIPHLLLLRKLLDFGFSNEFCAWFKSFLLNRKFMVRFLGNMSSVYKASSGVPQGSNLGPLLFIIFINDLFNEVNSEIIMYADDVKLFKQINDINDHTLLQLNLNKVFNWSVKNSLPLNLKKTIGISFSRKTNKSFFPYEINTQPIEMKPVVRDLGVYLDDKLYFVKHLGIIVSKARRNLGILKWICRSFSNLKACKIIYYSIVRSHLEYASEIWNLNRKYIEELIESVQNSFLSWLNWKFKSGSNIPCNNTSLTFNLCKLSDRREMKDIKLFHGILHGKIHVSNLPSIRINTYQARNFDLFFPVKYELCPVQRCAKIANKYNNIIDFFHYDYKYIAKSLI
jgi:hypothetical protein